MNATHKLVLYDGSCGLCDRFVRWILQKDVRGVFRFVALESAVGQELLRGAGLPPDINSVVLTDASCTLIRSRAVRAIVEELGGPRWLLFILRIMPVGIADLAYRLVARYRHRLFPSRACELPSAQIRERFVLPPPQN